MAKTQSPKEAFFAAAPPLKTAEVQAAGQVVKIREMSVGERLDFEAAAQGKPSGEVALLAVVASVVDDDGNLIFGPDDLSRLRTVPIDLIQPLMKAVLKLNALTDEDVGELAKN